MHKLKTFLQAHTLPVMVASVIVISSVLVSISMYLYYSSDAFRLDLSRPDYAQYRDKIDVAEGTERHFASQGAITPAALDEFLKEYDEEQKKSGGSKAFANDVLSDDQLGIGGAQPGASPQDNGSVE